MDASQTDAESCVRNKPSRSCKLTLLVALQILLLTACLLGTLYVYWSIPSMELPDDVHIQFFAIADISGNKTLEFNYIQDQNQMDLSEESRSRICIQCTGPYVLHMYVCYKSTTGEASGSLELQVKGNQDPRSTFELRTSGEVCRGLHGVAYLRKKEEATLHLYSTDNFRIKNVTVGFNYLLGSRCEF